MEKTGGGMEDVRYNAWLILRALDRAASGQVGKTVNLHATVADDGTQNFGPDYDEAMWFLIDEAAIEDNPGMAPVVFGEHPGGNLYWAVTPRGKALYNELSAEAQ